LRTVKFSLISGVANPSLEEGREWDMEMKTQATKLQAAEDELKQLMADVSRAMRKAEEAIARIAPNEAAAMAETESST
jgi:hypothetical protein